MSQLSRPIVPHQAGYDQQRANLLLRSLTEQRRLLDVAEACVRELKRGESLAGHPEMISTLTLLAGVRKRNHVAEPVRGSQDNHKSHQAR